MLYELRETKEALADLEKMVKYIVRRFKNVQAAYRLLEQYDIAVQYLKQVPFGYREIGFVYRGCEIRKKPFETYNIFYVVNSEDKIIYILRVLKDRQDWNILFSENREYHF